MIAQNKTPEPDEDGSIEGTSLRARGTRDTRLIERALREGWPIPEDMKQKIVDRQVQIAIDATTNNREATSAAKCLASMSKQNVDVALKLLDKVAPDQHELSGTINHNHRESVKDLLDEPDYVEWLRKNEADSDPRLIRANGHKGNGNSLDDGQARNGHRP